MDVFVLQKTANSLPDFPYPVEGNFRLEDFKHHYDFRIYEASAALAPFVAYYSVFVPRMSAGQELRFTQILQVPAASLMFGHERSLLFGVATKRIDHRALANDVKIRIIFKPAGLRAFCPQASMPALVDNRAEVSEYFPSFSEEFSGDLLEATPGTKIPKMLDAFLLSHNPAMDENIVLVNNIIRSLDEDNNAMTVRQLASKYGKSERTMQALFRSYVGVGLKWVMIRARLVKVLRSADNAQEIPWAQLAADFGYSTQSHLIHDFKNLFGKSPSEFIILRNTGPEVKR